MPGGRMLDPAIVDGRKLGPLFERLRVPLPTLLLFGGMMVGKYDVDSLLKSHRSVKAFYHSASLVGRYVRDRLSLYRRVTRFALCNAFAGLLLQSVVFAHVTLCSVERAHNTFQDARRAGIGAQSEGDGRFRMGSVRLGVLFA